MAPFVCLFERSGAPVDALALERLAGPLAAGGREISTFCAGPFGLAVDPSETSGISWSTTGGSGPLSVVVGRILEETSGRPLPEVPHRPQDGRLDVDRVARSSGSFVLLSADLRGPTLSVVHDHLGTSKVSTYVDDHRAIVTSDAATILRDDGFRIEPDERTVARFLSFRFSLDGGSFLRRIGELLPAHWLRIGREHVETRRYWRFPDPDTGTGKGPRGEIEERFRLEIRGAISRALGDREPRRVALSLSSGLDSTALAVLSPREIRWASWFFEDLAECDEREGIEAMAELLDHPVQWVRGDDCHPLSEGFFDRFLGEASPYVNPFALLKARLYDAARAEGCRWMMVGDAGDALFAAAEYWLRDQVLAMRPGALGSLARSIRHAWSGDRLARVALRRVLVPRGLLHRLRRSRSPWTTPEAAHLLGAEAPSPALPSRRHHRHDLVVGAKHIELEGEERRLFAQLGVGRLNPYWDRHLLEWFLSLPADCHSPGGPGKPLLRSAFRELLPPKIVRGGRVGTLGALFLRGLSENRASVRDAVFERPRSDWARYVDRRWLEPYLDATATIRFGHTILWRVLCYERWVRRLDG